MLEDMKRIADEVTQILENDPFPQKIRPDYLKEAVYAYPCAGGKRIRPALTLWSTALFGGDQDSALPFAAALEVWHNWTLVHDDIIDGDETRRGRPAAHCQLATDSIREFQLDAHSATIYGRNMAILCGDLQQSWANSLILAGAKKHGVAPPLTLDILERLQQLAAIDLISGEAVDVELAVRNIDSITPCEVMEMYALKTGALFRCACETGAALALGTFDRPEVRAIGEFAVSLGIAFQLQDDLLGTFGDFRKLGKDIGSDLRERKTTVLLLKTLELADHDDLEIVRHSLGRADLSESDLQDVRDIMLRTGAYDFVRDESARQLLHARGILAAFPANRGRENLEKLLSYLTTREQ